MSNRPKDFGVATVIPNRDDYLWVDGTAGGSRKMLAGLLDDRRNALAPRGGLSFDGTTTLKGTTASAAPLAIGTDDFSISCTFQVPKSNPTGPAGLVCMSANTTQVAAPGFLFYVETDGKLKCGLLDSGGYRLKATVANLVTDYAGKVVTCTLVRSGTTVLLYINGISQALGADIVISSPVNANFGINLGTVNLLYGFITTAQVYSGQMYAATVYNTALTSTDILEIYELGGGVPFRFQFGSQANIMPNTGFALDPTVAANGRWALDTNVTWNSGAGTVDFAAAGGGFLRASSSALDLWSSATPIANHYKAWRIKFEIKNYSAGQCRVTDAAGGNLVQLSGVAVPAAVANGVYAYDIAHTVYSDRVMMFGNTSGPVTYSVDNVFLYRIGAVAHIAMDDGIGRIARDASSNNLHVQRSANGIDHIVPKDDGIYPQLGLTANGEFLDSAGVLRTDAVLVDVIVKNTTANAVSQFAIGMTSGGDELTYRTDIPANSTVVLPIKRADLAALTIGTSPFGRCYYSALTWNSGSLNISIRYRRERDI